MKRCGLIYAFAISLVLWILVILIVSKTVKGAEIDCNSTNVICIKQELTEAEHEKNQQAYQIRANSYKQQVEGEIKRKHELDLVEKKIEVLGRLQMLKAPTTNVVAINSNTNQTLTNTGKRGVVTNE